MVKSIISALLLTVATTSTVSALTINNEYTTGGLLISTSQVSNKGVMLSSRTFTREEAVVNKAAADLQNYRSTRDDNRARAAAAVVVAPSIPVVVAVAPVAVEEVVDETRTISVKAGHDCRCFISVDRDVSIVWDTHGETYTHVETSIGTTITNFRFTNVVPARQNYSLYLRAM